MCAIPIAGNFHEKVHQSQTSSLGSSHIHVATRKACQTMCTIHGILSPMHWCAESHNETSSTLSMDHWLNAVCHCQWHSCNRHFISRTLKCISLNNVSPLITNYLFSSIHFSPILKENLHHHFAPISRWYKQRSGAILRDPTCPANANTQKWMVRKQMLDNIFLLTFYSTLKKNKNKYVIISIHNTSACLLEETCSFD